jgi:hypothetical protein
VEGWREEQARQKSKRKMELRNKQKFSLPSCRMEQEILGKPDTGAAGSVAVAATVSHDNQQ